MSNGIVEFAKMLKERENKNPIDRWIIGTVISTNPVKVKTSNFDFEESAGEIVKIKDEINVNSKVVLIPSADYQRFLLIGEVK